MASLPSFEELERLRKERSGATPAETGGSTNTMPSFEELEKLRRERSAPMTRRELQDRVDAISKLLTGYGSQYSQRYRDGENHFKTYRTDTGDWMNSTKDFMDQWYTQSRELRVFLRDNSDIIDSETAREVMQYLETGRESARQMRDAVNKEHSYYSKFKTEEDFAAALEAELRSSRATREDRQKRYGDNQKRIEELEVERQRISSAQANNNWAYSFGDTSMGFFLPASDPAYNDRLKAIDEEIASLKSDMTQYERGEGGYTSKTVDDYYNLAMNPDFEQGSANRDFGNATKTDYDKWHYQTFGGVIIDPATGQEVDESYIRPGISPIDINSLAINDPLGFYLEAKNSVENGQYGYMSFGAVAREYDQVLANASSGSWGQLTEGEISIYYYLFNTQGAEAAKKYLEDMKVELNRRATEASNEYTAGLYDEANVLGKVMLNAATVPANVFGGTAGFIEDTIAAIKGDDINPYSAAHSGMHFSNTVRKETAEDLDATGFVIPVLDFSLGDIYQVGMSRLDSALATGIGGGMGTVLLGMGAAENEAYRLYQSGASPEQVTLGALAAGAAEAVFEYASFDKLINLKDAKTVGQWVKNALIQGGIEASEEGFTEIANIVTNAIIMGGESDWAKLVEENGGSELNALLGMVQQTAQAMFGGFLGGLGAGTTQGGKTYINTQSQYGRTGETISSAGGVDALMNLANEVAGVSPKVEKSLTKQVGKVEKNATNKRVGKLYDTVATASRTQNLADIAKSLESKGISHKNAAAIAEALVAEVTRQELSDKQLKLLKSVRNDSRVQSVISDVIENSQSTMEQRSRAMKNFEFDIALGLLTKEAGKAQAQQVEEITHSEGNFASVTESASQVIHELSDEGKMVNTKTGDAIEPQGLVQAEDGTYMIAAKDAGPVSSGDVHYADMDQALVYETFVNLETHSGKTSSVIADMDLASRNELLGLYNPQINKDGGSFVRGILDSYFYGHRGTDLTAVSKNSPLWELTEQQRKIAWNTGRTAGIKSTKAAQSNVDTVYAEAKKVLESGKAQKGTYRATLDKGIILKTEAQKAVYELADQVAQAVQVNIRVYEGKNKAQGFYKHATDEIWLNLNAANTGREAVMAFTLAHELVHRSKKGSPAKYQAFVDFLMREYGKQGSDIEAMIAEQIQAAEEFNKTVPDEDKVNMTREKAFEEVVCDACQRLFLDTDAGQKLAEFGAQSKQNKGFLEDLKKLINEILDKLRSFFKNATPGDKAAREFAKFDAKVKNILAEMFADMATEAGEKLSTIKAAYGGEFAQKFLGLKEIQYNFAAVESHKDKLQKEFSEDSSSDLKTLMARYDKIIDIWTRLGGELNSKFLADWNSKVKNDRAFTIFKAQAGYKYNVELSSMCKKGVPLFEAIDTIVKKEVMKELELDVLGKAEKEILYDILKQHHFEIPCAICYVEQARQREGVIIDAFLNGKVETNAKGVTTKVKLGWNQVLESIEKEMKANGVDYTFAQVSRDIATEKYIPANLAMDSKTQVAFYAALKKIANQEIARYNKAEGKSRKLLSDVTPEAVKECFKGTLPANLNIFKVMFNESGSLFKIQKDLLYSSVATQNLSMAHNKLYGLFNMQGGVSGYKTKQGTTIYWGDILGKSWKPDTLRNEGGVRNQSNSDFQMYTLLDQAQMYMDFTAKGYYLQAYTKVLSELKLFGLSRGKINASLIPKVVVYRNADGSVDVEKTMASAGLDENGNPIYDDIEGINHAEAFMLIEDPEYSKSICGICIGYSDAHIEKLLDDPRVQQIIGFHDKTDDGTKRYKGARYAKNYNGLNEAVNSEGKTVHIGFNPYVKRAEKKFQFNAETETYEGTIKYNGKTYTADDIPRLAADLYLEMCAKKGYTPAYKDFAGHPNYYKLLADFGLYDSQGHYAPHRKVVYNMPDTVPYLDANGKKQTMSTYDYIKAELVKELTVRDSIAEALADTSDEGIIPQFKAAVKKSQEEKSFSLPKTDSDGKQLSEDQQKFFKESKVRDDSGRLIPMYHGTNTPNFTVFDPQQSDDHISLFFTSDPDVANTYTQQQDKGRDVDPYNLITEDSSADEFNAAQEKVGGGLRVVKITREWIQEMKAKAEKSATRLFGVANKYADLLAYNNSAGMFTYDIERIREITGKGVENLKTDDINKLRKAMGDAQQHSFFAGDHKGAEKEIRRLYSDTFKLFDEVWNYKTAAATPDGAIGQYTYTETNSSVPFMIDRKLDFLGHIVPLTEREAVGKALERMKWVEEHNLGNRYKVYLNITNPYIIDAGIRYSGKMDRVSLERRSTGDGWRVEIENAEDDVTLHMTTTDFMAFIESAFDTKTTAKIKAQIEADNEAYRKEWGDEFYADMDVDHDIHLQNVNINYIAPGNWNDLFDSEVADYFDWEEDTPLKTRDVTAFAKAKGYDGVIFKNMKDAGGYAFMKGRGGSTVAAAFSSEQVKSVDNANPTTNPDIRYSLPKTDSDGKQLSEDQQEFFEKSRVRDAQGRLKVVYHGGTVEYEFDTTRGGNGATQYGPGSYFTDSEYYAKEYTWYRGGNVRPFYLNIEKMFDDTNISTTAQMPEWNKLVEILQRNGIEEKFINGFANNGFAYMSRYLAVKAGAKTSSSWEGSEKLNAMLREAGFQGIKGDLNDSYQYVIFTPNQAKLTTNEVPSSFFDIRYSLPKITEDMSDTERYAILEDATISVQSDDGSAAYIDQINSLAELGDKAKSKAEKIIIPLAKDLGILNKSMSAADVDIEFIFSKGNGLQESLSKQLRYGGNYADFAKTIINLDKVINSAVLIEKHGDKYKGTSRENRNLEAVFVMVSAFRDGDYVIPIQLEIKKSSDVGGRLYLTVAMTKIEASVLGGTIDNNQAFPLIPASITYNLADIFREINPKDRHFLKYLPDGFLSEAQKEAKRMAIEEDNARIASYKLPVGEDTSPRALLANAFEGIVTNDIEKRRLQEYKGKVEMLNAEEQKLHELRAEIKELSFAKGKRDTKRIKELQFEAVHTANRIATLDKMLLRLEVSAPLQSILEREKKMAYKRAEQKGKEALEAYRKAEKERDEKWQREVKDKYQASKKKAIETRDKREAREKLQKLVLDTVKWITYPSKTDVKCPDILKQPYSDFLNGIDLSSQRLANGGDPTKNDLRLASAMSSLATALERVMVSQDPNQETTTVLDAGYLDLPANFVQMLRDMTEDVKAMMGNTEYVVNRMPAEEIKKLTQMIRTLNHAIKEVSTLYANLRFANVEALGDNTMTFIDALGEIEKTGGVKDFVQWDNALPFYAFKRFGEGGESIFEGLMDAQDKLAYLAQKIFDFREKAWTDKEAKEWSEDTHTIDLPNDSTLTLTTADAMSIYCLSRRQQGLQHLLGGGTRVIGLQKGSQKAKDSRSLLTIKDIETIISSLTDRQKQVADAIQEFMSTVCSEWGNEISMKRFLTKEFNEKFYFPIESNDENLSTKDPSAQQSDLFRLLNISATKPIDPRANNEVIIRNVFDVFANHASDMARLNAYGMPLLDYMKWLNYREKTVNEEGQIKVRGVRKSMELAFGNAARSYVLNLVKDINGRPSDNGDPTILMKWMRNAKIASVGANFRVAVLQFTAYPRAAMVLSTKSISLGLTKVPQIEKAKKYCGIALWKSFGFYDTNIARSIEDQMKGAANIRQKIIELSMRGAEWGDAITWGALWNACEYEVAATKKYHVGSEEFYQAVGKKLREVVYSTQVVDSTLTRSSLMRSKRGMAQEAASFMSEPTITANILMDAGFQFEAEKRKTGSVKAAWQKTGKHIGRAFAVYGSIALLSALVESLADAWRDDDDDEPLEKFLEALPQNLLLNLLPFNKVPIISDVVDMILANLGIGFFSSEKLSTQWLSLTHSAVEAWGDVLGGKSNATVYGALYKTVKAISSGIGLPIANAMREAIAIWNNTAGAYDITWKIRTWDLSKTDLAGEALDAIIEGNERQANSIRTEFLDEDSYQSAMRTAIKNRYTSGEIDYDTAIKYLIEYGGVEADDAYWKAEGWMYESETGEDFSKYNEFFTAVETGKDLKATIKKYTDNGVTVENLASQITSHYKPLYIEMTKSEKAGIKGYLLNAYEQCGVEREAAAKKIQYWEFLSEHPGSEITQSQAANYNEFVKPAGVSLDLYSEYCNKAKAIEGDDAKKRKMEIINSLPLTKSQKDALYYAEGWAKSKLNEAPWH